MVAVIVAVANCVGTTAMCIPRALTMAPRELATDLTIPWHNLAHFCCAKMLPVPSLPSPGKKQPYLVWPVMVPLSVHDSHRVPLHEKLTHAVITVLSQPHIALQTSAWTVLAMSVVFPPMEFMVDELNSQSMTSKMPVLPVKASRNHPSANSQKSLKKAVRKAATMMAAQT